MCRAEPNDVQGGVLAQDAVEPVVLVLVDEDHPEPSLCLPLEGGKEPSQLLEPVNGRDDKVE